MSGGPQAELVFSPEDEIRDDAIDTDRCQEGILERGRAEQNRIPAI